jgi:pyruvate kinase
MVNYPTTRIPLLLSFRRHLQDPEDVTTLLQILSDWFSKRSKKLVEEECHRLLPTPKDIKKTTQGVWVVVGRKNAKLRPETVPSLEKVMLSTSNEMYT